MAIGTWGIAELLAGRPAQAVARLEEAVRYAPDRITSRVFLAAAYADLHLPQQAEAQLQILKQMKPDWQQEFLGYPDLPFERGAAINTLQRFLSPKNEPQPATTGNKKVAPKK